MHGTRLTAEDCAEVSDHGLSLAEVERQIAFCMQPRRYLRLLRPCTRGDGILTIPLEAMDRHLAAFDEAARGLRLVKFVPASGAATRMFQEPLAVLSGPRPVTRADLQRAATAGDKDASVVLRFLAEIRRFPFCEQLSTMLPQRARPLESIVAEGDVGELLDGLLKRPGLGCAELPKALLPFHRYGERVRTAFEEHLVEAVGYVRGSDGTCRLHFTVSAEHLSGFLALLERIRADFERTYRVRFEIGFSVQKASTDSVAVTPEGALFRTRAGRLMFRPGGHGALIENLAELDADIALIKNVDNVAADPFKEPNVLWSRVLVGLLAALRTQTFELLARLSDGGDDEAISESIDFCRSRFGVSPPLAVRAAGLSALSQHATEVLDRPLRVCGMVRNDGEPGGGPFWVESQPPQIVERNQVDPDSIDQQRLFASASHFNPVNLVCSLRDRLGRRYDLSRYVDPDTAFVVEKTSDGRCLRALERPGLWNGAMARWNSVFVEVPPETFAPVKSVNDLLRPAHQPLAT